MTTYTNMGRFENDREATIKFRCEGCKREWVANCDETYVENSHYSYYESRCPSCNLISKEPA